MKCEHEFICTNRNLMVCTNCGKTRKYGASTSPRKKGIIASLIIVLGIGILVTNPMNVISTFTDEPISTADVSEQVTRITATVKDIPSPELLDHTRELPAADKLKSGTNEANTNTPVRNSEYLTFRISSDLKPYESGIIMGLEMWNHKFNFKQTDASANIEITRLLKNDERDGQGCLDCLGDSTIEVVVSSTDCNGEPVTYGDGRIANIVAHEFGHNIGLEHNNNEEHMMYTDSTEFPPQIPYNDLGYDIPVPLPEFLEGEQELREEYDVYQKQYDIAKVKYDEIRSEYDELKSQYDEFLLSNGYNPDYPRPLERGYYDRVISISIPMNALIEPLNEASAELNEIVHKKNAVNQKINCIIDADLSRSE